MGQLETDLVIIGAGPTGLFAAYYAGFRGFRVAVVDSLPELGGQITAMYPEKLILDVAGFPRVKGRELVEGLVEQANTAEPDYLLDRTATALDCTDDAVDRHPRRRLDGRGQGADHHRRHRQVQPAAAAGGRRLARARHGVLRAQLRAVRRQGRRHRRRRRLGVRLGDQPRADRRHGHARPPPRRLPCPRADRPAGPRQQRRDHHQGPGHRPVRRDPTVAEVEITVDGQEPARRPAQAVVAALGFVADLGPLQQWGIEVEKRHVVVDSSMRTNLPRVFAAGDVTEYPGKVRLIAVGFGEAATAVNNAAVVDRPERPRLPRPLQRGQLTARAGREADSPDLARVRLLPARRQAAARARRRPRGEGGTRARRPAVLPQQAALRWPGRLRPAPEPRAGPRSATRSRSSPASRTPSSTRACG